MILLFDTGWHFWRALTIDYHGAEVQLYNVEWWQMFRGRYKSGEHWWHYYSKQLLCCANDGNDNNKSLFWRGRKIFVIPTTAIQSKTFLQIILTAPPHVFPFLEDCFDGTVSKMWDINTSEVWALFNKMLITEFIQTMRSACLITPIMSLFNALPSFVPYLWFTRKVSSLWLEVFKGRSLYIIVPDCGRFRVYIYLLLPPGLVCTLYSVCGTI